MLIIPDFQDLNWNFSLRDIREPDLRAQDLGQADQALADLIMLTVHDHGWFFVVTQYLNKNSFISFDYLSCVVPIQLLQKTQVRCHTSSKHVQQYRAKPFL
jgi:hypothetical protein